MGTSVQTGDQPFATLENIMIFDGASLTAPVGEVSIDWIKTLEPGFADEVEVDDVRRLSVTATGLPRPCPAPRP